MSLSDMAFSLGLKSDGFDRGMRGVTAELRKLGSTRLEQLKKELEDLEKGGKVLDRTKFNELQKEYKSMVSTMRATETAQRGLTKTVKEFSISWAGAFKIGAATTFIGTISNGLLGVAQSFGQSLKHEVAESFRSNSELQDTISTFTSLFAGNKGMAAQTVNMLRQHANISPFETEETVTAGKSLLTSAGNDPAKMMEMLKIAERLTVLNPRRELGGGLEGAAIALKEAEGGQMRSLQMRFNISKSELANYEAMGLKGTALIDAVLKAKNIGEEAVMNLGKTFSGRMSTIKSFIEQFRQRLSAGVFQRISDVMGKLGDGIVRNWDHIMDIADGISLKLADGFTGMIETAKGLWPVIQPALANVRALFSQMLEPKNIQGVVGWITDTVTGLINWISAVIKSFNGHEFGASLWKLFKEIASMVFDVLVTAGSAIGNKIKESLPWALGGGKSQEQKRLDESWEKYGKMSPADQKKAMFDLETQKRLTLNPYSRAKFEADKNALTWVMAGKHDYTGNDLSTVFARHTAAIAESSKNLLPTANAISNAPDFFTQAQQAGQARREAQQQADARDAALYRQQHPQAPAQRVMHPPTAREQAMMRKQNAQARPQRMQVQFTSLDGHINPIAGTVGV